MAKIDNGAGDHLVMLFSVGKYNMTRLQWIDRRPRSAYVQDNLI